MRMWQQSKKDALLVALAGAHTIVWGVALWQHAHAARMRWLVDGLLIFLTCTNYQCIAHNFLHLPFFASRRLNSLFGIWNTLLIGVPQTLYKHHHLNHHRFNSDYRNAAGETGDFSSLYRHSTRDNRPESIVAYSFLSPLRGNPMPLFRAAVAAGEGGQLRAELLTFLGAVALLLWVSPGLAWRAYLPLWYLGQVAAFAENYAEHFGARPGNRKTDSVSCYSSWYNWIWFNNGYHQEHHWRPQVHWSRVPQLTADLQGPDYRRVVRYSHWLNVPLLAGVAALPPDPPPGRKPGLS